MKSLKNRCADALNIDAAVFDEEEALRYLLHVS